MQVSDDDDDDDDGEHLKRSNFAESGCCFYGCNS